MIDSSYRDRHGQKLLPVGLQWNLQGQSHVAYYSDDEQPSKNDLLVAHNRWCFAKNLPFRRLDDIADVTRLGERHWQVQWRDSTHVEEEKRHVDIYEHLETLLETQGDHPMQVWINGHYIATLARTTLPEIRQALQSTPSPKLCVKQSADYLRIDRFFVGMIRGQQVVDHVLDNLYAMEDPEIIDERTLIGTATLPDWIMGGKLTSRIHVHQLATGDVEFERPLYQDDIATSDRSFTMTGNHPQMPLVLEELARLRFLASILHPLPMPKDDDVENEPESNRERNHRANRRKQFGF